MSKYLDDEETRSFDRERSDAAALPPAKKIEQGDTTLTDENSVPSVFEPGTKLLDKFEIDALIGRGGMGSVYRVKHLLMGRTYALKCLNKYQNQDGSWRRFQNEAKAAQILDHQNLIKVYEVGLLPGGQPYFLMELVDGITLADQVAQLGHLPIQRALKIFIQVAFAIGYAHENRVIHRDLKPSNIMLVKNQTGEEIVKVVDFGIAKLTGVDEFNQQTLTKTGEIFGSPLYMSPEQCMGSIVDQRSDLYSLGCVFYESLTSAPPFLGESALATMMKHQGETQLSLKEASLGIDYPVELEMIITKLLQKDPNQRYQSGDALARDLISLERSFKSTLKTTITKGVSETTAQLDTASDTSANKEKSLTGGNRVIESGDFGRAKSASIPFKSPNVLELATAAVVIFAAGIGTTYLYLKQSGPERSEKLAFAKDSRPSEKLSKDNAALTRAYEKSIETRDSWSTVLNGKREFFFPAHEELGTIVLDTGEEIAAKGQFSIPARQAYGVIANKRLLNNLTLLKKFENDELAVFDFKNVTPVKGAYEVVSRFRNLRGLNVFSCEFTDKELDLFKNQNSLLSLNIGNTAVSGAGLLRFPPLKNLNCLDISYMNAAQSLLPKIREFPNLKQLTARKADLRDEHIAMLANSDIKVASLAWNHKLSREYPIILARAKSLEVLNVSATKITPKAALELGQLSSLKRVILGTLPWENETKTYIKNTFASEHPKIIVSWSDEFTRDHSAAMPAFQWKGEGLEAHECPLATLAREAF